MDDRENLSIIMIGQNESLTLPEALERCIPLSNHFNLHIIYVDSDSKDNSVKLVHNFAVTNRSLRVTILHLTGHLNAAIARNAGLQYIADDDQWIFFLDADVVLDTVFIVNAVASLKTGGNRGTVTGRLKEVLINDPAGNMHERMPSKKYDDNSIGHHGGNFLTSMNVIRTVGQFDERLAQHEDFDFCVRARRKGWTLFFLDEWLGTHYTISYNAPNRIWSDLKHGRGLSSGLLVRKYLFSRCVFDALRITKGYSVKLGIILMLIGGLFSDISLLIFFGLVLFALILVRRNKGAEESTWSKALSFLCGINMFLGFFYFPSQHSYHLKRLN